MLFETKKIQLETLNEYLKEVRQEFGLSLEEVAKKTGIKLKFLQLLEEGELEKLPPDVYVLGFLRQLSRLYRIESDALIQQYKKERGILQQVARPMARSKNWSRSKLSKLVITPKILSVSVGIAAIILTVSYIAWQVFSIDRAPNLVILEPQNNQVVTDSFVNVRGHTDSGMTVTVNGQDVFVDNNGDFKTQLGITPGPRDLTVVAQNKFGKDTDRDVSIMGQSTSSVAGASTTALQLKLDFSGEVILTYSLDGNASQTVSFHAGDSKLLTAEQKAVISTSDAGATKVTLNGQPLGSLGRPKEQLANIPFFAESGSIK